ncbi:hypothetical protein E2562_014823 [Oryza meyeriana var. granulata]|uniref:Uncharacterized protein n=1 Tax=Oryza meyeriana var. granulata TaxID=110450 RepID=A0A6G1BVU2_9ORYZ|nr:hypothetical protein E2562_014823 [Oryza meyeriana var. granulata]
MESPQHDGESHGGAAAVLLHEMLLRARREGEEPELPDEQLRSNDQLQQDEVPLVRSPTPALVESNRCLVRSSFRPPRYCAGLDFVGSLQ